MLVAPTLSSQEVSRVVRHNKQSIEKGLVGDLHVTQWETVLENFSYRCPFTGAYDISMDHFIPESIGHGGTYLGNVYPISSSLNASKNNTNPFLWRETLSPKQKEIFDEIVLYLANQLHMELEEFRAFVFWCFGNPRSPEQIEYDKQRGFFSSLHLFRHQQKREKKRERVLAHFAKEFNMDPDFFVDFVDWCLKKKYTIDPSLLPAYINSLFSHKKCPSQT